MPTSPLGTRCACTAEGGQAPWGEAAVCVVWQSRHVGFGVKGMGVSPLCGLGALLVACLLVACAEERVRGPDIDASYVDAGAGFDGGPASDGGSDAGAMVDSGADAGDTTDAGDVLDAGRDGGDVADAGTDGGEALDAGTDAGGALGCPAGPCNLVEQTGCEAGYGCYFVPSSGGADPEPMCLTAGTGGDGATCVDHADCQEGFLCAPDDTCHAYCCGGSDVGCPTGQVCSTTLRDSGGSPTEVGYCSAPDGCDPVEQTGCSGSEACYWSGDGGTICTTSLEDLDEGATCDDLNDCAAGLACHATSAGVVCHRYCDTTDGSRCTSTQTCTSLSLSGAPEAGICTPASS